MAEIKVLDQYTIDNIAAGEVVERPSSVVKELVENAIDAKANAITVEIKEGGIKFIRITDNGTGIDAEQIPTAFLRHATSKIRTVDDLMKISSLGFRGEALSSIAAVGQVELISKTADNLSGVRYEIHGGKEITMEEIGCPEGTTLIVRNLFYNVPARRKFLKTPMTEAGYIEALIRQLAMSHPEISFKLVHNNQNKLSTSGNGNEKDVIYHIYGRDIAKNLLSCEREEQRIKLHGYIGKPAVSRGNRGYENYFVNGRYIKNGIISRAIEDAYKTYQMVHKYPFTSLMVEVPMESLDVNVHPNKLEVRFSNGEQLYRVVYEAVREALQQKNLIPNVGIGPEKKQKIQVQKKELQKRESVPEPFEPMRKQQIVREAMLGKQSKEEIDRLIPSRSMAEQAPVKERKPKIKQEAELNPKAEQPKMETHISEPVQREIKKEIKLQLKKEPVQNGTETALAKVQEKQLELREEPAVYETKEETQVSLFEEEDKKEMKEIPFRIIGQLFATYWLLEANGIFYIMDQHAAHEKVNYEKLMAALKEKKIYSQQVAPPLVLSLSIKEAEAVEKYQETFKKLGFIVEEFGGNEYCIRAVPANLYGLSEEKIFIELLDSITEDGIMTDADVITNKIASMSCKAAVKGNQVLSLPEVKHLLEELMQCENPYTCPHGRPTMISMTKKEIEKKFKRIV